MAAHEEPGTRPSAFGFLANLSSPPVSHPSLTPEIKRYLAQFSKGFKGHLQDGTDCRVSFMQSDGSLVDFRHFSGLKAILCEFGWFLNRAGS